VTGPPAVATDLLDGDAGLSTQPAEPPRARPGRNPLRLLLRGWRRLTSMRTALVLLFLLALAAVPGSLLPQRQSDPARVVTYLARHPSLGPVLDRLSLFDVFGAPWFAAVYLLLFTSLVGCVLPRTRLHLRAMTRRPPRAPARLTRLPHHDSWRTALPVDQVVAAARVTLRGSRFRTAVDTDADRVGRGAGSVAAEKGYLRETGNLIFHVALLALLAGIGLGSSFGYEGDRVLVAGPSSDSSSNLIDAPSGFDDYKPGRAVDTSALQPFTVHVDRFTATYDPTSLTPKDYVADVRWRPSPDAPERSSMIKVNHPLVVGSTKVYLLNHGYAPVLRVRDRTGAVVSEGPVVCRPIVPRTLLSDCVAKIADLPPAADGSKAQVGLRMTFAPTGVVDPLVGVSSSSPVDANPDLLVQPFVGDLGLDSGVPQSVYDLDTSRMTGLASQNLVLRDPARSTLTLPGGYTVDVPELRQWVSVEVKHDPAKPLVLLAAILIIGGLLLSLGVRRRRVWLRGTPQADGSTLVEVGGLGRTRSEALGTEVARLAGQLRTAIPMTVQTR